MTNALGSALQKNVTIRLVGSDDLPEGANREAAAEHHGVPEGVGFARRGRGGGCLRPEERRRGPGRVRGSARPSLRVSGGGFPRRGWRARLHQRHGDRGSLLLRAEPRVIFVVERLKSLLYRAGAYGAGFAIRGFHASLAFLAASIQGSTTLRLSSSHALTPLSRSPALLMSASSWLICSSSSERALMNA
jgi:hypothetical protein